MLAFIHRGHPEAGFFVHALQAFAPAATLEALAGNVPAEGARYVCVVPVHHFGMLQPNGDAPHYAQMEPGILADVRAGRAVILFDMSNTGRDYVPAVFDEILAWIEANDLPAGRVIWLSANAALGERARLLAGMRAGLIRFLHFDFFVRATAWFFSPHAAEPLLGRDVDAVVDRLLDPAAKDRLLLSLSATPRLHRMLTLAALQYNGLLEASLVSHPAGDPEVGAAAERFVTDNPALAYLRPALAAVSGLAAARVDDFPELGKALWRRVDPAAYARTYFSLVQESDFSDGRTLRVTEKLAKAFCLGHPALVLGNPHAVRQMTALGFQDWDGVLDRSAEEIAAPAERFEAVMREVLRQALRVRMDPAGWLARTREVSAFNIRHAMGGGMLEAHISAHDNKLIGQLTGLVTG